MPSKSFLKSRKEGKVAQAYVTGMFQSWGWKVREIGDGYHPDYDHQVYDPYQFFNETKYDKKFSKTHNIYLDINSLSKSKASILTYCLNDPIDTVLMMPLKDALDYAIANKNIERGGEWDEPGCCIRYEQFVQEVKPKVLTTN